MSAKLMEMREIQLSLHNRRVFSRFFQASKGKREPGVEVETRDDVWCSSLASRLPSLASKNASKITPFMLAKIDFIGITTGIGAILGINFHPPPPSPCFISRCTKQKPTKKTIV